MLRELKVQVWIIEKSISIKPSFSVTICVMYKNIKKDLMLWYDFQTISNSPVNILDFETSYLCMCFTLMDVGQVSKGRQCQSSDSKMSFCLT